MTERLFTDLETMTKPVNMPLGVLLDGLFCGVNGANSLNLAHGSKIHSLTFERSGFPTNYDQSSWDDPLWIMPKAYEKKSPQRRGLLQSGVSRSGLLLSIALYPLTPR